MWHCSACSSNYFVGEQPPIVAAISAASLYMAPLTVNLTFDSYDLASSARVMALDLDLAKNRAIFTVPGFAVHAANIQTMNIERVSR
jgi:hypothetical protein